MYIPTISSQHIAQQISELDERIECNRLAALTWSTQEPYRSCSGWLAFRDFDFDLKGILPDKTCLLYWLAESRPIALCPACYRMLTDGGAHNV
jgi:hypothetical protein